MGQSTNAILFYGYCWEESEGDLTDDDYETGEEGEEEFGVGIASHCSCDYAIPYVFISESKTTAYRGSPEKIDPASLQVDTTLWDEKLEAFIRKYNIDMTAPEYGKAPMGPGWFLVSHWC